jgi:hypothetical protein
MYTSDGLRPGENLSYEVGQSHGTTQKTVLEMPPFNACPSTAEPCPLSVIQLFSECKFSFRSPFSSGILNVINAG